ncbi:helix-turn-helix domain-containing protein [Mycobacteroides abscessus subsp. abscessus]|uniref:helix-turn-helix domain-containing protein n=1 Tax=Mycobacteroides abscessus TaxID=36809 RepID=UPI0039F14976
MAVIATFTDSVVDVEPEPPIVTSMVSVKGLAQAWDIHPDSIKNLVRRGELRAYRVGRQLRIKVSDAEAYLAATSIA